jgi:hypothetical protein
MAMRTASHRRPQRRILEAAAAGSVLSGAPSVSVAAFRGSPRAAVAYTLKATRAVGTMAPSGRPGLIRGSVIHAAISVAAAELLAVTVPRRRSAAWGTLGGLVLGLVNMGIIAPRWFPALTELELGPQIADNVAFGLVFAVVADR